MNPRECVKYVNNYLSVDENKSKLVEHIIKNQPAIPMVAPKPQIKKTELKKAKVINDKDKRR